MDRFRRFLVSDHAAGWAFILPSVILIVVFGIIPIVWGLILSFQKAGLISPEREWVGLGQLREDRERPEGAAGGRQHDLLHGCCSCRRRSSHRCSSRHALNRRIAFVHFYRLAVFIPVVTSTIATGIMFLWLFDKNYGLANWLLGKVGLGPFGFFEDPNQAHDRVGPDDGRGAGWGSTRSSTSPPSRACPRS